MIKQITLTLSLVFFLITGCRQSAENTSLVRAKGTDITITWELVENYYKGKLQCLNKYTITNTGNNILPADGWELYFNQIPRKLVGEKDENPFDIVNVNGDYFKIVPNDKFKGLESGESITFTAIYSDWIIKEADAPAGFYFVFYDKEGNASAPEKIKEVEIVPFTSAKQTDRLPGDSLAVTTAESRYISNSRVPYIEFAAPKIIPTPVSLNYTGQAFTIDNRLIIYTEEKYNKEAAYLSGVLKDIFGKKITTKPISEKNGDAPNQIILQTSTKRLVPQKGLIAEGNYTLKTNETSGISIEADDSEGIFNGIQSLRSLFPVTVYQVQATSFELPEVIVNDAPRFSYRGMHLDVARNFHSKESVLKLLDLMALYKLNKFHFHLSDDEGWRLAIPGLPELTEVGAYRGHTFTETDHLFPAYGSGPDRDNSHGSGFYSKTDYMEILRYANERHIEVIPEIDMPGHARAAIKSMQVRYDRLMQTGDEEAAKEYLLYDPNDKSEYRSIQYYNDNVVCPCMESTYNFIDKVVEEVVKMHKEAGAPITTIHTGGDEVPHGVWEKSPHCAEYFEGVDAETGKTKVSMYFLKRYDDIITKHGLITGGWEEIAYKKDEEGNLIANEDFVDDNFRPYVWNNVWGWGQEDVAYKLANAGYETVLSNATNLYFDLSYNKDPDEPGYYWATFVDTKQAWRFVPLNIYASSKVDRMGVTINEANYAESIPLKKPENIIGIQGQLWSETVKGQNMMEYYICPKIIGMAERAWHQASWESIPSNSKRTPLLETDWNEFANILGQYELPRLTYLFGGYNYRIAPPGAIIENGMLKANTAFPGQKIYYTTDGTEPTNASFEYTEPVNVKGTIKLKVINNKGRSSKTVVLESKEAN